ncbi:MAG: excalibur calcium-binding domain-containing protein [Alsobacter sp.]
MPLKDPNEPDVRADELRRRFACSSPWAKGRRGRRWLPSISEVIMATYTIKAAAVIAFTVGLVAVSILNKGAEDQTVWAPSVNPYQAVPSAATKSTAAGTIEEADASPGPYFPTCAAARAAGYSNIPRGAPGYAPHLDRDGDGIACEPLPYWAR